MRYVFADCELDTELRALSRGGHQRSLRPKPFQILIYLIEHRDRVISKQELAEQLWPDQFISDSVIENGILAARRVVGDNGRAQRIIQTLHGHGYRFVSSVSVVAKEADNDSAIDNPSETRMTPPEVASSNLVEEEVVTTPSPAVSLPEPHESTRQQLTIMFCDLVGASLLSSQVDPEDYLDIGRAYHDTCSAVIEHFRGHLAQSLGDGLLVYFGYPQAHEDDAQRAVYTALGILGALEQLNNQLKATHGVRVAVRVGIHTGLVVVSAEGTRAYSAPVAIGWMPNIATRLQEQSAPDTIVVSEAVYQKVHGYFDCQALGAQYLREMAEPISMYQVLRAREVQSRFAARATRSLTPLVGREREQALLIERWNQTRDGNGHVICISGEAGIGKSRLVQALKDQTSLDVHSLLECQGSPYYQHTAFWPLIELLPHLFEWQPDESRDVKVGKMEHLLEQVPLPLEETLPLLAALVGLSLPDDSAPPRVLTPEQQRQKTFVVLLNLVLERTSLHPILFVVEDLHWIDPSTLEFLELLVDQSQTAALLTVVTSRPIEPPSWLMRAHVRHVTLDRLIPERVEEMIGLMAGEDELTTETRQQIVSSSDGVPLFVEEVTRMILEAGGQPALTIPSTLQDLLMSRLDRLMTAKRVAQQAAVIGREFSYDLLQVLSQVDEETLQQELRRLVASELIYQHGLPPQSRYVFKHALIKDAAYESLLRSTKQGYHRQIAEILVEQFPDTVKDQPELLAHHCTEAGLHEQAVDSWYQAGQRAAERSAYVEAIAHLTKGLDVLQLLPDDSERLHLELTLQTTLGPALMAINGYAATEVQQVYHRARKLCQQIGDTPRLFQVLLGLRYFYQVGGALETACELGEQCLSIATDARDAVLSAQSHTLLGHTQCCLGEFAAAHEHLTQSILNYDAQQHARHARLAGLDPGVFGLSVNGWVFWFLGYPNQALDSSHAAITLASELSHPQSLEQALRSIAQVHHLRRELEATHNRAEASISLSIERGFQMPIQMATVLRGWVLAMQGQCAEGISQIQQGMTGYRSTGGKTFSTFYLAMLAEAYLRAGRHEEGISASTEALELVDKMGERWWEAEIQRLKGELLLDSSDDTSAEAEICFHQALSVARSQQAKSWELRAATSLARLWQSQNRRQDAYDLLVPIYGWFTEGFDTADLQDAEALLAELDG